MNNNKIYKVITLFTIFSAICAFSAALAAPSNQGCLSYWTVGASGCDGKVKEVISATESLPPPMLEDASADMEEPAPTPRKQPKTLDEKIDDFYETYDKPPREFVAFNLEPSLENAVKWVQKFNEMMDRNRQIATAWAQAQVMYQKAKKEGVELEKLDSSLPDVPDYGVDLPMEYRGLIEAGDLLPQQIMPFGGNITGNSPLSAAFGGGKSKSNSNPFGGVSGNLGGIDVKSSGVDLFRKNDSISGGGSLNGSSGKIKISYYFSAECPYCQKFEPEFKEVIKNMQGQLDVSCVDMTPSGQEEENIYGKVDCSWRPIAPGEMKTYGIESTPTLIISRGEGKPLERLAGYVPGDKLEQFLRTGKSN